MITKLQNKRMYTHSIMPTTGMMTKGMHNSKKRVMTCRLG